jgi:hypothetical protein
MYFYDHVTLINVYSFIHIFSIFKSEYSYRVSVYLIFAPAIACLVAVLVHSTVNDKSVTGLKNLVTFQWDYLLDIKVWQMSFSSNYH